jgi:hypothetical protein
MLKTISSITNALGALNYKGTWNALTNSPTLADGTGAKGDYYVTSTAGTQTFGGLLLFFGVGDWIVYNGAVWQRVEGGSDGNFANITLNSTDAGATAAPLLDLYRDSASPAASDTLGEIEFNGEDSAGNKQQYALIHASILSPTSTAESGQLHFETATGGASTEKMIIGTSNLVINEIGAVFNVRIEGDTDANLFYTDATNSRVGVGTISPAAKLDVNGEALINGLTVGRGGSAVATNTALGASALTANTSGTINTAIGSSSGSAITTGAKNTILGSYTGNSNGLDIRTKSSNVVLSDGDGNPTNTRYYAGDVSTTAVDIAPSNSATGGLHFVSGYNTSTGAQGWWLIATLVNSVTIISSSNGTGLTVTFGQTASVRLNAVTSSGTINIVCTTIS